MPNSVRNFNHDEIRNLKIEFGNETASAQFSGRNGCRAGMGWLGAGGSLWPRRKRRRDWPGITVDVLADQPVATAQSLKEQADGFHRLAITLSNKGKQPLTIEKITVRIPVAERLTDDLEMLYGGSCMGQTPLLRQNVGTQTKQSSSHMYEMVRLADGQYLFAGSLSWRIFLPNFTLKDERASRSGPMAKANNSSRARPSSMNRSCSGAPATGSICSTNSAPPSPRRTASSKLKDVDFKGWATWDYYAYVFSADDIYDNMEKLKKLSPAANLVQIDAGWYSARGDYKVRTNLAGGMKGISDRIKAAGMTPGIWIDGFRANSTSEVCIKHPEYFLHDQDGNMIIEVRRKEGPDRDRVYFDYSHPGARAHIAERIRAIKEELGFPYFKDRFHALWPESGDPAKQASDQEHQSP